MHPSVIKAGKANLFQSEVFCKAFVGACRVPVALYHNDASRGAALGAGIGSGYYRTVADAFSQGTQAEIIEPDHADEYEESYRQWKTIFDRNL
jgi:xylulokinase